MLATSFNPPSQDPQTSEIIVTPNVGVIYTGSKRKQEEHGGFAHDDTNVIMLLSNPTFKARTITTRWKPCKSHRPSLKLWDLIPMRYKR